MNTPIAVTLIQATRRNHDHFALGLGEIPRLVHERVVVGKEGAELVGTMRQGEPLLRHWQLPPSQRTRLS
jgi:hypothetical protein